MKEFRSIKFSKWFENKLMKEQWNASALVNDGFTYEVIKETEKAIQIEVINNNKLNSSWTIWSPKSAIENLSEVIA